MNTIHSAKLVDIGYAIFLLTFGYFLAHRCSKIIGRTIGCRFSLHHMMLINRATFYIILLIFFVSSLQHLGFNLSVLLGAAGVFTVAISFASQTAISNLISGIFLLFERPFQIGDNIEVKSTSGSVESIDLLSTKIKTAENTLVRMPNETLMKSEIINSSYFATRRIELTIGVAYDSNIEAVKAVVLAITESCDLILKEPAPAVIINKFADSAIELKIQVWVKTKDCSAVKILLPEEIKYRFKQDDIEIPFPQITIHQG